jgi:hypothetical protein
LHAIPILEVIFIYCFIVALIFSATNMRPSGISKSFF